MVEKGFAYERSVTAFIDELADLGQDDAYRHDTTLPDALERFTGILRELQSHRCARRIRLSYDSHHGGLGGSHEDFFRIRKLLLQQAQATIGQSLRTYITRDVKGVRDLKKIYHRMSDELDSARNRRAACSSSKIRVEHEASGGNDLLSG